MLRTQNVTLFEPDCKLRKVDALTTHDLVDRSDLWLLPQVSLSRQRVRQNEHRT